MNVRLTFLGPLILTLSLTPANAGALIPAGLGKIHRAASFSLAPGSREMKPDQVNVAGWNRAWTNLVNDAEQSFVPSMPRLLAVEVELVVGNANASQDDLTLAVLDNEGTLLASITQQVKTAHCEHALFELPEGGVDVMPGQTYWIRLEGGTTLGWKYVVGGYPKGEATFNGKPLLPKARSTFLFRTFGAE